MKRINTLIFLILCPLLLTAQEFMHYDITDGLSGIEVNDIKENENFLWIATSDGLNRFDGENFKVFKRENGSENSLNGNNIETLFFDSDGFLWIGLKTGGVDIYDPRHDKFRHLYQMINVSLPARIISIAEDSERNIWLGTWEEGVYKLTPEDKEKKSYKAEIHYPGFIVSAICEKPKGYVRIGTYSGLYVYSLADKKWTDSGLYDKSITQFLDTGDENAIWCSTWNSGLLLVSWNRKNPAPMEISRAFAGEKFRSIHRIIKGTDNKLYLGTWGEGIKIMDIEHSDQITSLASEIHMAPLINCMFRDRSNNIWIGAFGGGIYKFNPDNNFIRYFPSNNSMPAPVMTIADFGNNQILTGTQGKGIYLCNLKNNKLALKLNHAPNGGFSNYILSLYADNNYILAGHDGAGAAYFINKGMPDSSFKFKEYLGKTEFEKLTAFYPSGEGKIWIGTKQNGLFSVNLSRRTNDPAELLHYETFGRDEITGFAGLNSKQLFISSHNGLFLFNTDSDKIDKKGRIIVNDIIYRILKDEINNCLWLGTSNNLLRLDFDRCDTVFNALPDGVLPQGAIRVLILDKNNNLWFSIRDRLFCLINKERRVFELNPVLLDNKAILSGTVTNIDGVEQLVFGTTDNIIILDPQKILSQSKMPRILFTGLEIDHRKIEVGEKVYGNIVLDEATEYVHSIKLSHRCRWISLSFAEKEWDICRNKFQFRIKGFSDTWQYLDLHGPITISQLNPGNYNFEIRRYDMSEVTGNCWSMEMTILPPWWETTWFYILFSGSVLILISLSALALINYFRKSHLLKLNEIEKQKNDELLREKESFFTGLSHDLMTPFSLILSPVNDLLRERQGDDSTKEKLEIISKNTSFLADIFGTILDFKRVELSDNRLKEVSIEIVSFSRIVLNAFEYLAKSRKIALNFDSTHDSLNILTDNVKIERILYNLLSNAIKFTPDNGSVSLHLEYQYPFLSYKIQDNGCGMDIRNHSVFEKFYREPDKPGFNNSSGLGLGLYIVKKFVTLLNGEISVDSSPGNGTEINVIIPVRINEMAESTVVGKPVTTMDENMSIILVVEDNDQMREYVSKKLGSYFNVITAANGMEALKEIEKYLPEIIITDVMMPEMDGLSLCRNIKTNSRYSDLLVVLISAKISTEDELVAYQNGADIYIKKPFDSEILLNQMINIHTTRQKRKSQLMTSLLSKEDLEIEFDPKETFIKRSMKLIEENIMDADFKIDKFASEMNLSNAVLHRKFKLFVGQTPNQFIRLVRLRKSVFLLRNSDHTIAEIANLTGFNQSHYFIKCFREVYNDTPKNFREHSKLL